MGLQSPLWTLRVAYCEGVCYALVEYKGPKIHARDVRVPSVNVQIPLVLGPS